MYVLFRFTFPLDFNPNFAPDYTAEFVTASSDRVLFRSATAEEREANTYLGTNLCVVIGERRVEGVLAEVTSAIHSNRLPQGIENAQEWSDFGVGREPFDKRSVPDDMPLDPRKVIRRNVLPKDLRDLIDETEKTMTSIAREAAGLLRWRLHLGGSHKPLQQPVSQWSLDGNAWLWLPFVLEISMSVVRSRKLEKDESDFIEESLVKGREEPLARQILEEARSISLSNPRGALLLAMVAVEVALKRFISEKVPNAQWFVKNVPSPPVVKIVEEYIPELCGDRIPEELIKDLRTAVVLRNEISHLGEANVKAERLQRTLQVADQLLNYIDTFAGYGWARDFIK